MVIFNFGQHEPPMKQSIYYLKLQFVTVLVKNKQNWACQKNLFENFFLWGSKHLYLLMGAWQNKFGNHCFWICKVINMFPRPPNHTQLTVIPVSTMWRNWLHLPCEKKAILKSVFFGKLLFTEENTQQGCWGMNIVCLKAYKKTPIRHINQ